jgi:DNA mismatch repair protein MutS
VLRRLEAGRDATGGIAAGLDDLPLFAAQAEQTPPANPLREAVEALQPDTLSPREALEFLYRLKALAAEQGE